METFANNTNYLLELLAWQNATPNTKAKRVKHMGEKPKKFIPDFLKTTAAINDGSIKGTVDDVKSILSLPRGV